MVYLVDDDIDDLDLMKEALLENSYKGPVLTLTNGQLLMDKLSDAKPKKPDVIILDLNLPLKDGFAALKEIKNTPALLHIPVIVLTASSSAEDEIKCLELGCSFFFTKPFKIDGYTGVVNIVKKFIAKTAA